MYLRNFGTILLGTTVLGACNQPPPINPVSNMRPPAVVAVSAVVNVIKCELNYTFTHDKDPSKLDPLQLVGAVGGKTGEIDGTLHLENVIVDKNTLDGGLEIGSAIKIGPSGNLTRTNTNTQTVDVKFTLEVDPNRPAPTQCAAKSDNKTVYVEGHPFFALLDGIASEYNKINPGSPRIALTELDYTSQFDVESDVSGGVKLEFLIFSAEQTAERDLTSTQSLELDFKLTGAPQKLQFNSQ